MIDEIMKKAAVWALAPEARLLCSEEWKITDGLEETEGSENE
ncbi:MAG: hypothetical protein ACXVB1_13965 [Pseudobdellovibrionaceae bacterium]